METSHIIHTGCAALFFMLLAFNSLFLFTRSGEVQTPRKKTRNIIYKICGWGMLGLELIFLITRLAKAHGYFVMILEILLLSLFGLSWLVKGGAFPFLNDTETAPEKAEAETAEGGGGR